MIQLIEHGGTQAPLCQLKITLTGLKPPVWRRVLVPASLALDRLHHVIQIAMGWTNSHLHHFIVTSGASRTFYGTPNPDFDVRNEKRSTLAQIAPAAKSKFKYEYDFGDSWFHEIRVEKILPPDPQFSSPICLAGKNACPPEDCGGIYGYTELLAALADPTHERHEEFTEWLGGPWDPTAFDLNATNQRLKKIKT